MAELEELVGKKMTFNSCQWLSSRHADTNHGVFLSQNMYVC